jgi:hypothetical protein
LPPAGQRARLYNAPPQRAIDQANPVRTSRKTVGTMTELNDHVKLVYARAAQLYCRGCGQPVRRDTPDAIFEEMSARAAAADDPRLIIRRDAQPIDGGTIMYRPDPLCFSTERQQACEGAFYLGEDALIQCDLPTAYQLLEKARNMCPAGFFESSAAHAELKRMREYVQVPDR